MNIGIIGQGFVGNAIYQKFKNYYDVKTFDIKGMMHCNSNEQETLDNEVVFICLPTPMNQDGSCHIDIVEAAIKRASQKDLASFNEINYEGKGPHGVLVYVECATDNPTRTVANVKSYFNKAGGMVVPNGSMEFMFSRKSIFEIVKTAEMDPEMLELELIDAGCEGIEMEEELIIVTGDYTAFGTLAKALEDMSIEVQKSNLQRIPTSPIDLTEEQMNDVEKLLDKIEDDDDIQQVFTNIS